MPSATAGQYWAASDLRDSTSRPLQCRTGQASSRQAGSRLGRPSILQLVVTNEGSLICRLPEGTQQQQLASKQAT